MANRGGRGFARALVVTTAMAGISAGSAQAATVNIGSSLAGSLDASAITLSGPVTVTNFAVEAPGVAASPTDGTVITWKFIGLGPLTPRVIHPVGGGLYVGAGTGSAGTGTSSSSLAGPFTTNLPIKEGDLFGWNFAPGGSYALHTNPSSTLAGWVTPALADGGTGRAPSDTDPGEGLVQATVRYCVVPKVKGKTPKAAKKALRAADCTVGKVKKAKKTTKKKKVLSSSAKAGTSISDTQPVDLKVSRKA